MKTLILIRHANALSCLEARVQKDFDRPLSPQGEQKAALTAQKLLRLGLNPGLVLHSPLKRAAQSAQIITQTVPAALEACTELNGLHDDRDVCEFLAGRMQEATCLAAVGHNPNIAFVLHLFTKQTRHFAPGSFAVLNFDDPHHPQLVQFEE